VATKKPSKIEVEAVELTPEQILDAAVAELALLRHRLQRLEDQGGFGLIWEDIPENVERLLVSEIPVLASLPSLDVKGAIPNESPHVLIEGDNLHALHILRATHAKAVDVIYIDPPYNTGNKDFAYNDQFVSADDVYRHSKWLSFMNKRIEIALDLLADDGFLAVSIDDNEMAHLKLLLIQHFGDGNVKVVAVKTSETTGMKMASVSRAGSIPKLKEYVLIAQRGGVRGLLFDPVAKDSWDDEYKWVVQGLTRIQRSRLAELVDAEEGVSLDEVDEVDAILNLVTLLSVDDVMRAENVVERAKSQWRYDNAWRIVRTVASTSVKKLADTKRPTIEQVFFAVQSKRDKILYIVKGDYSSTTSQPRLRLIFADDNLTKHPGDFWPDIPTTGLDAEGGVTFTNGKKPLALLRRIIGAKPKPDALVLDFFAGSGTTAQAVMELNQKDGGTRRAVLVTNNEGGICREVTLPRLRGVLTGQLANGRTAQPLPGSLAFYKTDFITRRKNLDRMRSDIAKHTVDLVAIKEGATRTEPKDGDLVMLAGTGKTVAVVTSLYPDYDALHAAASKLVRDGDSRHAHLFTWSDQGIEAETVKIWEGWDVQPLPAEMLSALRRLAPAPLLFTATGEEGQNR
jgi:adenine-specific DNA-methyltransferase